MIPEALRGRFPVLPEKKSIFCNFLIFAFAFFKNSVYLCIRNNEGGQPHQNRVTRIGRERDQKENPPQLEFLQRLTHKQF